MIVTTVRQLFDYVFRCFMGLSSDGQTEYPWHIGLYRSSHVVHHALKINSQFKSMHAVSTTQSLNGGPKSEETHSFSVFTLRAIPLRFLPFLAFSYLFSNSVFRGSERVL